MCVLDYLVQSFRRISGRVSKRVSRRVSRGFSRRVLKGVFAKNERGYRLNAIKKRF